ncbi:MAG: ABC transporter permease [Phycisphaerae bacterium]
MTAVLALAMKDLRLLLRDKAGFFFIFVFPILYASLFGAIMSSMRSGGHTRMSVAVVDEDGSPGSRDFVKQLEALDELKVAVTDRTQAADWVRRGKRAAYIALLPGFGEARRRMFGGEPARIETGIDPGRQAEAGMLQGLLTAELYKGFQAAFTDPSVMAEQIDEALAGIEGDESIDPISRTTLQTFLPALRSFVHQMPRDALETRGFEPAKIETVSIARQRSGPDNAYEIAFPQGVVWGIMGCAAGFGISLVVERSRGTLVRLRMAPIRGSQVLAGKALACFLMTMGVATLLYVIGIVGFGVRPDSVVKLALAVTCVCIAFVGIMMLLSVLGKTEQSAGGIGWAVLMVMAMIGGGMIPLAFMPGWLQTFSNISPIKWSILAMEGAVWRNFSMREMMTPCLILVGIGVGGFTIGTRAFRWFA